MSIAGAAGDSVAARRARGPFALRRVAGAAAGDHYTIKPSKSRIYKTKDVVESRKVIAANDRLRFIIYVYS